jgi:hypothetical protein
MDELKDELEEIRDSIRWLWTFPKEKVDEENYKYLLENIEEKVVNLIKQEEGGS